MMEHEIATVVVIDEDASQRVMIAHALRAYYRVLHYADLEMTLGMLRHRPSLLIVDEGLRTHGRRELVRTLKSEPAFRGAPVVVCRAPKTRTHEVIHRHDIPADGALDKPVRRNALFSTVSHIINRTAEAKWEALPDQPRQTLRESLSLFSTFTDVLEGGEALDYNAVTATCAPLVAAVGQSQHRYILEGLRDYDNQVYVHSMRVATLLTMFGHGIGLTDEPLVTLSAAGLVHDIGKLSVPLDIRNKDSALTADEERMLRGHVQLTIDYLGRRSSVPRGVVMIAGQHHERIDGSGYPKGLSGRDLNDLARMAAIVDVFAALTETRPFRAAFTAEAALAAMADEMKAGFDQKLVRLFREIVLDPANVRATQGASG